MRIISLLLLPLILLLSLTSQISADAGQGRFDIQEVDGYKVKLAFVDGDVKVGNNNIHVVIQDAQAQPINGINVNVVAEHYAQSSGSASSSSGGGMNMGGSGPTNSTSVTAPNKTVMAVMKPGMETGAYDSVIELAEGGHWMIKVSFPVPQGQKTADFDFDVKSGSNSFIIWIFAGISALIIVGAVIARRNRRKKVVVEVQA